MGQQQSASAACYPCTSAVQDCLVVDIRISQAALLAHMQLHGLGINAGRQRVVASIWQLSLLYLRTSACQQLAQGDILLTGFQMRAGLDHRMPVHLRVLETRVESGPQGTAVLRKAEKQ